MTAWVAVNKSGEEIVSNSPLHRLNDFFSSLCEKEYAHWCPEASGDPDAAIVTLPKGSIYKLIGKELTWKDEPVEI